jgi:pimeloyl-ACP methyl ester carboxylesterase
LSCGIAYIGFYLHLAIAAMLVSDAATAPNRRTSMTTVGHSPATITQDAATDIGPAPKPKPDELNRNVASIEERATINGIELGYRVFGEGMPLILLHGAFSSREMFGPNIELLAAHRQVIAVDLQSHGRSPASDRPMRYETMADDVAALIDHLGFARAAVMGFSLGGLVGLRMAIQHPEAVERLVLVSTVFTRKGWYPEIIATYDAMGPETADHLRFTPLYQTYEQIAPAVDGWPILVQQVSDLVKLDYDWSAAIPTLPMPVMLVAGDADGLPPSHAADFFALLGGGQRDASWDRSGMTHHRLAILPGVTHYDISVAPALVAAVAPFLGS